MNYKKGLLIDYIYQSKVFFLQFLDIYQNNENKGGKIFKKIVKYNIVRRHMMITIKEVKTKKEIKDFINFPLKLYKGNNYFVPLLRSGEKDIFKSDFPFNKVCDTVFYLAYDEDKVVGRIQGIIQNPANEKWDQKRVRFTRFDAINDKEVSRALFSAVENWAKEKGMEEFVGPLGYSDLEREGLLIEGFEEMQTFEEQYNYPYYQELIEDYGFLKDVDWVENKLYSPKEKNEKLLRVSFMMLNRYGLKVIQPKSIKEFIEVYSDAFFDIIERTYARLYGTMPLNDEIVNNYIKDFKLIVRPKDIILIVDENKKVCGFALLFPSISEAVRKSKGKITLPFLIRFLRSKYHPNIIDLGLIGISPEYESRGIATVMIGLLVDYLEKEKFDHLETNLMLEDNHHILNLMKHFERVQNKRRRCFKKNIGN